MRVPAQLLSLVLSQDEYLLGISEGEELKEERRGPLSELPVHLAEYPQARLGAVLDLSSLCRIHRFPFTQKRQVLDAIPLQLEGKLPEDPANYELYPFLFSDGRETLAATFLLPRSPLKGIKEIVLSPDLATPPRWLTLPPWVLVPFLPSPEGHHLLVFHERLELLSLYRGKVLCYRIFEFTPQELMDPAVLASLRVRILATLQELPHPDSLHLWGPPQGGGILERISVSLRDFVSELPQGEADFLEIPERKRALMLLNLKLLARGIRPDLNLAPPVFFTLPAPVRRQIGTLLPLAGLLLLSLIASFHTKTIAIRSQAEFFSNSLRAVFLRNLPGERPIYPLRQLEEYRNRALENQAQVGGRRVDRISSLTVAIPPEVHLVLDELSYMRGEWTLKGKVNDFQEVDLLKEKLSALSWVESLDVERAEQRQDLGKVEIRFRIREKLL